MLGENGHTTSLLEIRRFLEAEKAVPAPWAEPGASLESLYALLVARRDDPLFWSRLQDLVIRLEDHRVNLPRLGNSEAFGYATVEKLLADLRADLCGIGVSPGISWKKTLSSSLQATSLAAFLMLGTASVSCGSGGGDDSSADTDTSDTDTIWDTNTTGCYEPCEDACDHDMTGDEAKVLCDLVEIITNSNLYGSQSYDLIECLPSLSASYRETLLNNFESMSDSQIAAYLQGMLEPGGVCYEEEEGTH